jgi:NADP-dependent 3-hydroxy acid dehydrogenase YdfG
MSACLYMLTSPISEVGDPTIVVANAGVCRGKPLLKATKRDVDLLVHNHI